MNSKQTKQTKQTKQIVYRFLRKTHLLGLVDRFLFVKAALKQRAANKSFMENHPEIKTPPLHIIFDALHTCSYQGYYQSGIPDAELIVNTVRKYKPDDALAILEWGCGPARVIQHLSKFDKNLSRIVGSDYNKETIKWCQHSFQDIEFFENKLNPPLLLQDQSVDVVYAISVFTHLSEAMHYAWIQEILRVLKPGGLLLVTLHGEKKIGNLLPDEIEKFKNGQIVVREDVQEGKKHFLAYHSDSFVRKTLLAPFAKVDYIESAKMHQDIWVATAPLL